MQLQRRSATEPEMAVRRIVHAAGLRFRVHNKDLPGNPDLANRTKRWAVFVHGHANCPDAAPAKSNTAYWQAKMQRNRERDAQAITALSDLGFRVLVVWECEIESMEKVRRRLVDFLSPWEE